MTKPTAKLTKRQALVLDFVTTYVRDYGYPPTIREIGCHLKIKSTNGVNDHLKAIEKKGYIVREESKSRAIRPLFMPNKLPFNQWVIQQIENEKEDDENSPNETDSSMKIEDRTISENTPKVKNGRLKLTKLQQLSDNEPLAVNQNVYHIPLVGRIAAGIPISAIEHTEDTLAIGSSLLNKAKNAFALTVSGDSMIDDGIFDGDTIFVEPAATAPNGTIVAVLIDDEATVKRIYYEQGRVRLQPANSSMEPIYLTEDKDSRSAVIGIVVGVFRKI